MIPFSRKTEFSSKNNRTCRLFLASQFAFFLFFTLIAHSNCYVTVEPISSTNSKEIGNQQSLLSIETKQHYDVKWKTYRPDISEDLRQKLLSLTESGHSLFEVEIPENEAETTRQKRDTSNTSEGRLLKF